MKKKKINRLYVLWMALLVILLLCGVALLVMGIRQGPFFGLGSASL